jgi:hypothetical protein
LEKIAENQRSPEEIVDKNSPLRYTIIWEGTVDGSFSSPATSTKAFSKPEKLTPK